MVETGEGEGEETEGLFRWWTSRKEKLGNLEHGNTPSIGWVLWVRQSFADLTIETAI